MRHLISFFIMFQFCSLVGAQQVDEFNLSKWDPKILKSANSASDIDYLTHEEKKVIFITNLARINGPLFIETILDPYLEGETKTKYVRSLYKELSRVKDLPLLFPEKDLYNIAYVHAQKSGNKGSVGHQDFDKRFKPVLGKYNMVAENCAYGFKNGGVNAIQLLIDEGISSLGHRKNMLSPNYNSIGVAIQPHKRFKYNCVMDFGKKTD